MNELEKKVTTTTTETKPAVRKRIRSVAKPVALQVAPVAEPIAAPVVLTYEEQRKKEVKEKIARERAHKSKLVTGKFLFNECPGGELKFPYREFPGDQLVNYVMKHDTIHTIPLGVAIHLNDRCAYPEYQHNLDAGKAVDIKNMYIQSLVHRTSFIPLDFTQDTGYKQNGSVAQVTYADPRQHNLYNQDATGR